MTPKQLSGIPVKVAAILDQFAGEVIGNNLSSYAMMALKSLILRELLPLGPIQKEEPKK